MGYVICNYIAISCSNYILHTPLLNDMLIVSMYYPHTDLCMFIYYIYVHNTEYVYWLTSNIMFIQVDPDVLESGF